MAKLTNLRTRCICAVCGVGLVVDLDDVDAGPGVDPRHKYGSTVGEQAFAEKLTTHGWRMLVGLPRRLVLCNVHAGAYEFATEDELHFLRDKLRAHRIADRFALEFYIHNGRVVTEGGARPASSQELEMWKILLAAAERSP